MNSIKQKTNFVDAIIQKKLDAYVIATLPKYMKRASGEMIDNMISQTKTGTGKIINTVKYAKKQYYLTNTRENITGFRGRLWFGRWKQDNKENALKLIQNELKNAKF